MALKPSARYPGQLDTSDATGYPHGKAQNVVVEGDGVGTPFEKDLVNDILGFQQALLVGAAITPSNVPDKVGASQYLDALRALLGAKVNTYTATAFGIAIPAGVTSIEVTVEGGGGGGASGAGNTTTGGGGGGGSGYVRSARIDAALLGPTFNVLIGTGGPGGAGGVTGSNPANVGGDGTASSFADPSTGFSVIAEGGLGAPLASAGGDGYSGGGGASAIAAGAGGSGGFRGASGSNGAGGGGTGGAGT